MDGEIDLLIVGARLVFSFYKKEAELAAISAQCEVGKGGCMGVVPARPGRFWREAVTIGSARCDHRRALFHGAVIQRIDCQPVPVHNVVDVAGIGNIDRDRDAFAQAQQRSGYLPVIGQGPNVNALADLEIRLLDAQAVVGLCLRSRRLAECEGSMACNDSPASSTPADERKLLRFMNPLFRNRELQRLSLPCFLHENAPVALWEISVYTGEASSQGREVWATGRKLRRWSAHGPSSKRAARCSGVP